MPDDEVDFNQRFTGAVGYLTEWVKHIITLGSALMVLGAALLKDLVKGTQPPLSYVIAACLILSYVFMVLAVWHCLGLIRFAASCVLTAEPQLGSGRELKTLQVRLHRCQVLFLTSLLWFAALAFASVLAWAFGFAAA